MHEQHLAGAEGAQPSSEERKTRTQSGATDHLRQAATWLRSVVIRPTEEPQNLPVGEIEKYSEEAGDDTKCIKACTRDRVTSSLLSSSRELAGFRFANGRVYG